VAWLSVATFPSTALSSQGMELLELIRIPSREAVTFELLVTVLPRIWLRCPLLTFMPSWPALSTVLFLMMLSLEGLFG
jgi:hypothetical protein